MKIAVTAATGRLGTELLSQLSEEIGADRVVAIARRPEAVAAPGVETRFGDYADAASMRAACAGVDTAILISMPVGGGADRAALHKTAIEAARAAGVRKAVFTGVVGTEAQRETGFWRAQGPNRAAEEVLQGSGMDWAVARNGLYLDLDVDVILRSVPKGVYSNSGGDGIAPYISISELGLATVKIALDDGKSGRVYNLAGWRTTQADLVSLLNEVFGEGLEYKALTEAEMCVRLDEMGLARIGGKEVVQLWLGILECVRIGAYDAPCDFEAAAGRPCTSLRDMMIAIKNARAAAS